MSALPAPDPRNRHAGPNPTAATYPGPIDLRRPADLMPARIVVGNTTNAGGSYVTRVTRARVRRHLPPFLLRRTRYERTMRTVATSNLNASAAHVVALIDGEPWFTFDPDSDDALRRRAGLPPIERTPLQRALCALARDVHFTTDAYDGEGVG